MSVSAENHNTSGEAPDPFVSTPQRSSHHRFSGVDSALFSLDETSSPSQLRHALEAHLSETDRRIQDASKLGTSLVQQRKDLSDRLKDIEKQQDEAEIGPELRQKLTEIQKEYNDIGRESARASLVPRQWQGEDGATNDGQRAVSPSMFSSQATHSPSKVNVPSRKSRNQPSSRVQDIEFATEISTSLLSQVRNLQALLAEREETIKQNDFAKSKLETEAEGYLQRLRQLDESEQRYKDENWALETSKHEMMGAASDAADREKKLGQSLANLNAEKTAAQRELDELKQAHNKLSEESTTFKKHHDSELLALRRSLATGDSEKATWQRKIDELTAQNQELAKAMAGNFRREQDTALPVQDDDDADIMGDLSTPEHSPPPSPTKGTPRHSMLESETLKSSLNHAHRMIQNLKSNIHREKTEKVDLKRMLQEARDELELRRNETGAGAVNTAGKRKKTGNEKETTRRSKVGGLLGALRGDKHEVIVDDDDWEDHADDGVPRRAQSRQSAMTGAGTTTDVSDAFETAAESSDAFETATEREAATDADQPSDGVVNSSDEATETEESLARGGTLRAKRQSAMSKSRHRDSYMSTASTSPDEEEEATSSNAPQQRLRLKVNRGSALRRSKISEEASNNSTPTQMRDSPSSVPSSQKGPRPQSLFAELGDMGADDEEGEEGVAEGTPSRSTNLPPRTPRTPRTPSSVTRPVTAVETEPLPIPKLPMVDAGTMTEPAAAPAVISTSPEQRKSPFADGLAAGVAILADKSGGNAVPTLAATSGDSHVPLDTPTRAARPRDLVPVAAREDPGRLSVPQSSPGVNSLASKFDGPEEANGALAALASNMSSRPTSSIHADDLSMNEADWNSTNRPSWAFSTIESQETEPSSALREPLPNQPRTPTSPENQSKRMGGVFASEGTPEDRDSQASAPKAGFFGSLFGRNKNTQQGQDSIQIAEDETTGEPATQEALGTPENAPLKDLSNNIGQRHLFKDTGYDDKVSTAMTDQGSQTLLSSEQIENLLSERDRIAAAAAIDGPRYASPPPISPHAAGTGQSTRSQEQLTISKSRSKVHELGSIRDDGVAPRSARRPGSAGSVRSSTGNHPPLPPDHKQAIAAASQRSTPNETTPGQMGPPMMPASAYRQNSQLRPKTPSNQYQSSVASRSGATPRARGRSEVSSPVGTRRSSFSSFASELDERFNIRVDGMPIPQGLEGHVTDPRMIQAITQTMIGEYLWKYTRKTGRGQMSDNRHRRFFWVHPYTRTLYWSDQDPATAGRAELKAKSVAIEAVSVVSDDNPMPPGLHRKSLVIMTPGRTVKFTATTGQRHETWFNALSYLLLRSENEQHVPRGQDIMSGGQNITSEDVEEFNPSSGRNRGAAASLSSYNSRTTRNDSPSRNVSSMSRRSRMSMQPQQHTPTLARPASAANRSPQNQRSSSRLSHMFRNPRASFSSRRSRHSHDPGEIYAASEVHNSAEDVREEMARQEYEADRLENVRACCDGKHDVGGLSHSHKGRHHSHSRRQPQVQSSSYRDPAQEILATQEH